ncbi:MAG: transposase [Opitutaceae bacterium]|nr:transposase [Opitutaceae bacterium]
MARSLRIEAEGGLYHVINRGNYRSAIFGSDKAKAAFLACLGEACAQTGWVVHAWCLMSNHYHLAVETPRPNLAEGMRWLQGTFAMRFNRIRRERGHLFQGRYHSLLVESDGLGAVCHYIHLNPVRAGLCTVSQLADWPWTSARWLMQPKVRLAWYRPQAALTHAGGLADTPAGRRKYADYLAWLAANTAAQRELQFERMSRGWVYGTEGFVAEMANRHLQAKVAPAGPARREIVQTSWRLELARLLRRVGRTQAEAGAAGKAVPWKLAVAAAMKTRTTATNGWLTAELAMGNRFELSRKVNAWKRAPDAALARKVGLPQTPKPDPL